ncbi:hypothetical protein ACFQS3_13600 [Glycomyces mayteni]|uniref:Gram-positive cocci surface proteins LPxTG domain-containing protein n=1 Tax=Glycomyces mayteni TaxID=543887 RepID=A0ABW2DAJ3_9ACTN
MKASHPIRLAAAFAAVVLAALAAAVTAAPAQAQGDPYHPYLHSDLSFTDVAPGSTVEVNPRFRQEEPLADFTAAVVVSFTGSARDGWPVDGAEATADYDNCKRLSSGDNWNGVSCYFLDPPDLPGQLLTLTGPVDYLVDADAPGSTAVCACGYGVSAIDADELAWQIGTPDWDPDAPDLLRLTTADAWDGPSADPYPRLGGTISMETAGGPDDPATDPSTAAPTADSGAGGGEAPAAKLPATGAPTAGWIAAAAAAVLAGTALTALARRRPAA